MVKFKNTIKLKVNNFFYKLKLIFDILDSIEYIVQSNDKQSIRIKFKRNLIIESENYAFLAEGLGVHETKQFHMNPKLKEEHINSIYNYNFNKLDKQLSFQRIKGHRLSLYYIGKLKISNDKLLKNNFSKNEDTVKKE